MSNQVHLPRVHAVNMDVDLGYHVVAVYESREKAEETANRMNEEDKLKHPQHRPPYWVETWEVI